MNPDLPLNHREEIEARITALILGELSGPEAEAVRKTIAEDPQLAALHAELVSTIGLVSELAASSAAEEEPLKMSSQKKLELLRSFKMIEATAVRRRRPMPWFVPLAAAAAIVALLGVGMVLVSRPEREFVLARNEKESAASPTRYGLSDKPTADEFARRRAGAEGAKLGGAAPGNPSIKNADVVTSQRSHFENPSPVPLEAVRQERLLQEKLRRDSLQDSLPAASSLGRESTVTLNEPLSGIKFHRAESEPAQKAMEDSLTSAATSSVTDLSREEAKDRSGPVATAPKQDGLGFGFGLPALSAGDSYTKQKQIAVNDSKDDIALQTASTAPIPPGQMDSTRPSNRQMADVWNVDSVAFSDAMEEARSATPRARAAIPMPAVRTQIVLPATPPAEPFISQVQTGAAGPSQSNPGRGGGGGSRQLNESAPALRDADVSPSAQPQGQGQGQRGGRGQPNGTTLDFFDINALANAEPSLSSALTSDARPQLQGQGRGQSQGQGQQAQRSAGSTISASTIDAPASGNGLILSEFRRDGTPTVVVTDRGSGADGRTDVEKSQSIIKGLFGATTAEIAATTFFKDSTSALSTANPPSSGWDARIAQAPNEVASTTTSFSISDAETPPMSLRLAPVNKPALVGALEKGETVTLAFTVTNRISEPAVTNQFGRIDAAARRPAASTNAPVPQAEVQTRDNAFSTFSLNVSDVSFKLAAASLEKGLLPDPASVRSEEFINAFNYHDSESAPGAPISFAWERAAYPYAHNRDLIRLSIKTASVGRQANRPLNVVLLLDNSGSMERADRVQIVREAMRVLAGQLKAEDRISVITFARNATLIADGMPGTAAGEVVNRVGELTPEGGTNLEAAMKLAYETALKNYLLDGINRVVLFTDGAANLGNVEAGPLRDKVETYRKQGIALDCFGIGWEGLNDDLLESLSRNGDGRYGFLNSTEQARTEFAAQLAGALRVAASDVKVQVEFNPKRVTVYRQIGYAKHQLTKQQFRDNTVDAAELGAAESGNALYAIEVNPEGQGEIAVVRVRFKVAGTTTYREQEWPVPYTGSATALAQSTGTLRLSATAAAFAEWLVSSPYADKVTPERLLASLNGVPEIFRADARPKQLEWMIRQAAGVVGK